MRSSTDATLPGRCPACWVKQEHCVCPLVPQVPTRTRVLFVRHEREAAKSTGTARIAQLALPHHALVGYGDVPTEADAALAAMDLSGAAVLFPAEPQAPWPVEPPRTLVVIDGTWRQARKMMKKLPALAHLPRLALPPKPEPVLRLREGTLEGGRSTLEAVADALRTWEGATVADPLDALHAAYVERVFRARGVWELKQKAHAGRAPSLC